MQPGQTIEIQLVDEAGHRVCIGNVLLNLTLFRNGHRHYVFDTRPTSTDGRSVVTFDDLEYQRLEAGIVSLMDYNVPLTSCDLNAECSIPSESELRIRLRTMEEWNLPVRPAWVFKWPCNGCLAQVKPALVRLENPHVHIEIPVRLPLEGDSANY